MINPKTSILADDIEVDILLRLPVKSLLRFKSVSKRWYSLISDPSFISRYNLSIESSSSSSSRRCKLLCFGKKPITHPHVVLSTTSSSHHHHGLQVEMNDEELRLPPLIADNKWILEGADTRQLYPTCNESDVYRYIADIHIVGPIKGIYCIFHRVIPTLGGTLILWNPSARSYKTINPSISFPFPLHQNHCFTPRSDDDVGNPMGLYFGFGYDNSINDYKMVVICHWNLVYKGPGYEYMNARVYNNATQSWTTICHFELFSNDFPYIIISDPEFSNNFVNGACHWPCAKGNHYCYHNSKFGVLVFDMSDHSFKFMGGFPIPIDENNELTKLSAWVFRGTIGIVKVPHQKNIEVWMMKEYGVEDSWVLIGSVATQTMTLGPEFRVVGIPNDEWLFLGDEKGRLVAYQIHDDEYIEENGIEIKPYDAFHSSYRGTLGVFNYIESLSPIFLQPYTHNNTCTCIFRLHLFDW